jgi:hypothetical protein
MKKTEAIDINLNILSMLMTNFKIKFTENPSPIQVSNKNLVFITGSGKTHKYIHIELNKEKDRVEIRLE